MATVKFYLDKTQHERETSIYLYFSFQGGRFKVKTGENIHPKYWDSEDHQTPVKKSLKGSAEFNARLSRLKAKALDIPTELSLAGKPTTLEAIKAILIEKIEGKNSNKNAVTFFSAFHEYLEVKKPLLAEGTSKHLISFKNHLLNFQNAKRYNITFDSINKRFYDLFTAYLLQDLKRLTSTTGKQIKTLKTFMEWARERGFHNNFEFSGFKVINAEPDIIYLTEWEVRQLLEFDLSKNKKLANVRDVFCFGCFTGQRFSDIEGLKWEDLNGDMWLLRSQKTKETLNIPLLPEAKAILQKYEGKPKPLPMVSNQKTNEYLKELGELAGINEPVKVVKFRGAERIEETELKFNLITSHTARRTFVTLCLERGLRPEVLMKVTGHKSFKMLKRYTVLTEKVVQNELSKAWDLKPGLKVVNE